MNNQTFSPSEGRHTKDCLQRKLSYNKNINDWVKQGTIEFNAYRSNHDNRKP